MYILDMMLVRSVGDSICLYMRTVYVGESGVIAVNAYRYLFFGLLIFLLFLWLLILLLCFLFINFFLRTGSDNDNDRYNNNDSNSNNNDNSNGSGSCGLVVTHIPLHILSVDVVSTILLLNYRRPIDPERTTSEKQFVYVALQEKLSTHAT